MTTPIILQVKEISKRYTINHNPEIETLRELLSESIKCILRGLFHFASLEKDKNLNVQETPNSGREDFWALKNVSFTINAGERVGILGRNGAGKSTLLKILSRITTPTKGTITVRGRVTSLLEVGTGFHPDLTGRENIFLNGSFLGMRKDEIQSKFQKIVEFSEIEKFLDTPVKHYSSGMQVRLAFSVAAFLTPDILILDEVLAVGDHQFQQKCIKRMEEISESGCTVIIVSHEVVSIQKYCNRAILLSNGQIQLDTNDMNLAIELYKNS